MVQVAFRKGPVYKLRAHLSVLPVVDSCNACNALGKISVLGACVIFGNPNIVIMTMS